jgi:hypothetical protein
MRPDRSPHPDAQSSFPLSGPRNGSFPQFPSTPWPGDTPPLQRMTLGALRLACTLMWQGLLATEVAIMWHSRLRPVEVHKF